MEAGLVFCTLEVLAGISFVKQKTGDEMRISDRGSDVCSSDRQLAPSRSINAIAALGPQLPAVEVCGVMPTEAQASRIEWIHCHCAIPQARRVGPECVSTCSSWSSQQHLQ